MSDIFLRSDASLDAKLAKATSSDEVRELTREHFRDLGIISKDRGTDYGMRVIANQQPDQPAPRFEERDARTINAERVPYLSGNSRIVITSADGEAALDAIEAKLRSTLGGHR